MAFDENKFNQLLNQRVTSFGGFDEQKFQQTLNERLGAFGNFPTGKLNTSEDFYNLARQSGLQADADRVLSKQKGEEIKKIFSGGFISDVFDGLSALQYGVVGLLKGKSFLEGVKTRQSFTDKDALGDKGLPGVIAGIALDIAFDPLTYIAPATIVKKIPLFSKLTKAGKEFVFGEKILKEVAETALSKSQNLTRLYETREGGTRLGRYLASKFSYEFSIGDPVFRDMFERSTKNIAMTTKTLVDWGKTIAKIAPETAAKMLRRLHDNRFARVGLDELSKILKPEELDAVTNLYTKLDNLGKEAVDLGLLSKEKFEENLGEYIKNAYTEYELMKNKGFFGFAKTGIKGIKKRVEGLTPEKMKELGQIDNPAYLLLKSTIDLIRDVENGKLFKLVGEKFGSDVAQEGFTKLPTGVRLGKIAGKYVPDNIATYLNEIIPPTADSSLKQLNKQLVANFKFFKVIMNPGTHARNIVSNTLLNWWKLGIGPWRVDEYVGALNDIRKNTPLWQRAVKQGANLDTFAAAEMKNLLDSPEALAGMGKLGKIWQKIKSTLGNIYQQEENVAKMAAFRNFIKKGISDEEAWKAAESATFNYAQVTPFVRKLRESLFGFPFITFTVKATPIALETAYKYPRRISAIGKIKQGIENLSDLQETDRERASEPSWVRDGFFVKLPIKDKLGRSAYFDLTYILPFGDLVSGQLLERGTSRETGLPESRAQALLRKTPALSLIAEIGKNQDFYGNQIWRESDPSEKQLGDLMRHIAKSYLPPLLADSLPGGYDEKGNRRQRGIVGALTPQEKENQQRTLMQELLRNIGAKIQPIDADIQETYQEWNKKKSLQKLLLERGVLNQFNRAYVPKS